MNRLREFVRNHCLSLNWRWLQLRSYFVCAQKKSAPSLVLVPCEPWSVVGSRGDEAMVYAVLQDFRRRHPQGKITIITATADFEKCPDAARLVRDFNVTFYFAWRTRWLLSCIMRAVRDVQATEVVVLGADCMDGFWGVRTSMTLLAIADLSVRMGIRATLTPFSWNEHPRREMIGAFRRATHRLAVFVRDPVSYRRFRSQIPSVPAKLMADIAFLLEADFSPRVKTILAEMAADRARGKLVLGVNLNPVLKVDPLAVARQLKAVNAAVYCIPHDFRGSGDLGELRQMGIGRLVEDELSAAELKALASGCDAMFTSRMHLGIAALGMGVPMGGFVYQGKFAGLMEHFGLPQELIVSPEEPERAGAAIEMLLSRNGELKKLVADRLPEVKRMSGEIFG